MVLTDLPLPRIFLLPTHLQPEEMHRLEDSIPSLTYDVREASVVLGQISRRERALFELRRLKLRTEEVSDEHGGKEGDETGHWDSEPPGAKRRRFDCAGNSKDGEVGISVGDGTEAEGADFDGGLQSGSLIVNEEAGNTDVIRVLTLSWLRDSLDQGRLLPYNNYCLYTGRKLPPVAEDKATNSSSSSKTSALKRRSQTSISRDILQRAAADSSQGAKRFTETETSRPGASHGQRASTPSSAETATFRRPTLLHETTSEHDAPLRTVPTYPQHSQYACTRATPMFSPNAEFIEELKEIRSLRLLQGDEVGVRAYSTAIASLAAHPNELRSPQEITRLPGCSDKIAELFLEWRNTGQTREPADAATDPEMTALKLFYDIWGVGAKTARGFYNKGWRDLDDLVEHGWNSLSRVQQIGVKYYEEFQDRIPRSEVEDIAAIVLGHARKAVDQDVQMAIVGGYRRGKAHSGDVDVLLSHRDAECTAHMIEKVVHSLEKGRFISHTLTLSKHNSERGQTPLPWRGAVKSHKLGFDTLDKALVVWHHAGGPGGPGGPSEGDEAAEAKHRRVDIIVSPWKTVGCAMLGWSGATTFQRDLRQYCNKVLGYKFDSSGVRRRADGEWMDLEAGESGPARDMEAAEKRVFEGLGLPWRRPEERCTG